MCALNVSITLIKSVKVNLKYEVSLIILYSLLLMFKNFYSQKNYICLTESAIIENNISDVIQITVQQNYLLEIMTTNIYTSNGHYFSFISIFDNYVSIQKLYKVYNNNSCHI